MKFRVAKIITKTTSILELAERFGGDIKYVPKRPGEAKITCADITMAQEILNWKPGESVKAVHPDDRSFVMEQGRKKQLGEKDIVTNYTYRAVTKA